MGSRYDQMTSLPVRSTADLLSLYRSDARVTWLTLIVCLILGQGCNTGEPYRGPKTPTSGPPNIRPASPTVQANTQRSPDSSLMNDSAIMAESERQLHGVYGRAEYYDSLHYHVIRRWYENGRPMLVSLDDNREKITIWREYYVNGRIKEEGSMVSSVNIPIGIWNHYEPNGTITRRVDHDRDHPISYRKALEIAKQNGLAPEGADVALLSEKGRTYWQIVHWVQGQGSSDATGINVDVETGEVSSTSMIAIY